MAGVRFPVGIELVVQRSYIVAPHLLPAILSYMINCTDTANTSAPVHCSSPDHERTLASSLVVVRQTELGSTAYAPLTVPPLTASRKVAW